ncbi:MAG TPA: hypothetical protein VHO24_21075 [Opitutaceae bacterium]|nr:hypothetical protein [Opitutaceae bacterium]
MRKYLAAVWLAVAVTCLAFGAYKYGQCQAIAKSTGKQCLHGVSKPKDEYCWQHIEEKAAEAAAQEAAKLRKRIEAVVVAYANAHGRYNVQIHSTEAVPGWSGRYCTTCSGSGRYEVETKVLEDGTIEVRSLTTRY